MQEKPRKKPIILDANALFVPIQFKIDIFEELKTLLNANVETVLPSQVLQEIQRLASEGGPKTRRIAFLALKLAERCKVIEVTNVKANTIDDVIVEIAQRLQCPVFTNDRQLRKRLRDINVPVVYVRQKSHLEINGRL